MTSINKKIYCDYCKELLIKKPRIDMYANYKYACQKIKGHLCLSCFAKIIKEGRKDE